MKGVSYQLDITAAISRSNGCHKSRAGHLALGGGAKLRMLFGKAMKVDQEKGDTLYLYTIIQIKSGHTKYTFV